MLENGRISAVQATGFLISTVLATAILSVPSPTTFLAGTDAWLAIPLAGLWGYGVGYLAARLALLFPGETLIQFAPRVLGGVMGRMIGLVFVFYFFWATYVTLGEFVALVGTAYLPQTPGVVLAGVFMLLVSYLVSQGLEVYARVNGLILPAVVFSILLIVLLVLKDIRLEQFLPLLADGPRPVILASVIPGAWIAETAVILVLVPFIAGSRQKQAVYMVLVASVVLVVILEMVVVAALGLSGEEVTQTRLFPTFALARGVRLMTLPVFERMDPLFMVVWIAGMLVKTGAFFYAGLLGLGQWLNLAGYRPLVFPTAILVVALAVQGFPNVVYLIRYATETVPMFILLVNGGLSVLVYAATVWRGGGTLGRRRV